MLVAADVERIMKEIPNLTANGIEPLIAPKFEESRNELRTFLPQVQYVAACLEKHFRPGELSCSSYALKHEVERISREENDYTYISNGAFIAGAILSGYSPRVDLNFINVMFKITRREP
jgi:hypothetical protein